MDTIRTVELFAGAGGFRLGLEAASDRFKVIWANQWEPSMREQYAFECYTAHFGCSSYHVCQDIARAKKAVPDHDLLVGGFPCQDYSIMKKNSEGIEGKKGRLWWDIDYIIQEKRPKYILLENVDRILWSPGKQYGRDFSIILRCLYEKGYSVEWRVINAAEYGQAQRRRRTFIFAYHNQTKLFQDLAEDVCVYGIKAMHEYVSSKGIMAKAFPVKTHTRAYTDNWIDEMSYPDLATVTKEQRVHLYNSGVMMNGRIYSVDVTPMYEAPIPIKDILEKSEVEERFFLRDEDMPRWIYAKGAKKEDVAAFLFEYLSCVLTKLCTNVREEYKDIPILFAGGVMSNTRIRQNLSKLENVYFARRDLSSDNACGCALIACEKYNTEK
jgi:DNA (cytosine-5)-methyltransferase 1